MTVQAGIDWGLLEDSIEAPACEFKQHGKTARHPDKGPAEFYFRSACPNCGAGPILALCKAFADKIRENQTMHCSTCRYTAPGLELTALMEPIR